jgi:predicted ATPase with chaperone activity
MIEFHLIRPSCEDHDPTVFATKLARSLLRGPGQLRAPHHTSSPSSILGMLRAVSGDPDSGPGWHRAAGHRITLGELSLANNGVLLLIDIPEFPPDILEEIARVHRRGSVHLGSTATGSIFLPARFTIVATAFNCACGLLGTNHLRCRCNAKTKELWEKRMQQIAELWG